MNNYTSLKISLQDILSYGCIIILPVPLFFILSGILHSLKKKHWWKKKPTTTIFVLKFPRCIYGCLWDSISRGGITDVGVWKPFRLRGREQVPFQGGSPRARALSRARGGVGAALSAPWPILMTIDFQIFARKRQTAASLMFQCARLNHSWGWTLLQELPSRLFLPCGYSWSASNAHQAELLPTPSFPRWLDAN